MHRTVAHICIVVELRNQPRRNRERVLCKKSPVSRIVVPSPVIVQTRVVVLPPRVLKRASAGVATLRRLAEGLVRILCRKCPCLVGERQRGADAVCHEEARSGAIGPREEPVHLQDDN